MSTRQIDVDLFNYTRRATVEVNVGGVKIGNVFGSRYEKKAQMVGGSVLILLGLKMLVEGLLVLWDDELKEKLNLRVFVDCSADERIVRRLRRNMARGLSFDEISDFYLDMVRFRHEQYVEPTKWTADLIVNGSGNTDLLCEMLIARCKQA